MFLTQESDSPRLLVSTDQQFIQKYALASSFWPKQNVVFAKDSNDNIFGIQRINRKRKKFDTANFKIKHTDLFNQFQTELEYNEYKPLGDSNE